MSEYAQVFLKKGKAEMISRRHPWIFSGAINLINGAVEDGDVVEVLADNGQYLCTGHYQDASIKVRILSYQQQQIDHLFWEKSILAAKGLRDMLGFPSPETNAYRFVHAEGDGLSGLVIDIYGQVAVVQCHSIGMHRNIGMIAAALMGFSEIQAVFDKSKSTLPAVYGSQMTDAFLVGKMDVPITVSENGYQFQVDIAEGQKTGFFLDQRDNRALLSKYVFDKSVLNAFSYTGGFSVYALGAGAKKVISVDVSAKAIAAANTNMAINKMAERHEGVVSDVIPYLRQSGSFDVIILDPPAFAKSLDKRHNAVQGYKRLNLEGMKKVNPGGLLFTFSCSQVIDRQLFYNTVMSAAIESGRAVKVLHHLNQPPDHPVNIFHPEGSYLKGLVLQVH